MHSKDCTEFWSGPFSIFIIIVIEKHNNMYCSKARICLEVTLVSSYIVSLS